MMMTCITSTSYSLNLNGASFGYFKGRRGLRQGDPISPLVFCICMEYLSRVLMYATDKWYFRYHPLCKGLKLTHLLFAEDLLMFCKGDTQSIMLLLRALATFSATSGLRVNDAKSEVVFNGVTAV
ncbi:putative mitochondrial protein AtMg01250 [Silene latifolia]|uniref:putative mitochondrial protein AtMg01250 n=1 Tax=Silene latifolia TaxID=37657 RepID=UPI003D786F2D